MLAATVNSTYFDMLKEYDTTINSIDGRSGTQQHIERGNFVAPMVIQPANAKLTVTDDEIGAELSHQIDLGALPKPDANTVYMTYFPAGMTIDLQGSLSCEVFCGYHHNYPSTAYGMIYYGVHPDLGGNCALGCGVASSRFENLTSVTAHELAEVVTDPAVNVADGPAYPDAWNTSKGEEIGDLCASENTKLSLVHGAPMSCSKHGITRAAVARLARSRALEVEMIPRFPHRILALAPPPLAQLGLTGAAPFEKFVHALPIPPVIQVRPGDPVD